MDYQDNSNKNKAKTVKPKEDKVVERVISTDVKQRPPSIGRKFKTLFFGGEFSGALRYVAADVLLPAARNLLVDTATKGVERLVYGESSSQRRRPIDYSSRVRYNSPFMRPDRPRLPDQPPFSRSPRRETNHLVLASREEAELVLERMLDILDNYDVASVADLYELTGLPSASIDHKWGWSYLKNAEIRQVRDGYMLDLPPAEEL